MLSIVRQWMKYAMRSWCGWELVIQQPFNLCIFNRHESFGKAMRIGRACLAYNGALHRLIIPITWDLWTKKRADNVVITMAVCHWSNNAIEPGSSLCFAYLNTTPRLVLDDKFYHFGFTFLFFYKRSFPMSRKNLLYKYLWPAQWYQNDFSFKNASKLHVETCYNTTSHIRQTTKQTGKNNPIL